MINFVFVENAIQSGLISGNVHFFASFSPFFVIVVSLLHNNCAFINNTKSKICLERIIFTFIEVLTFDYFLIEELPISCFLNYGWNLTYYLEEKLINS